MNPTSEGVILIVDDNEMNRDMLARRLERKGYSTAIATSGEEALELLRDTNFDLILLDINMPDLNGIEVLKILRKTFSATELPVIMVSARDQSEDIVEALNLGANDYVTKPVDFAIALARIRTQLSCKKELAQTISSKIFLNFSIQPGEMFAHYRIEAKLGQGGMGAVYKAYDTKLERTLALKVILPNRKMDENNLERFKQEAKVIAQIKHPNIITVFEIGENYFTMEYVEGKTLDHLIKDCQITPALATVLSYKIADALSAAHCKGVIHRDLKPANIIIAQNGEPHLMDFGLAKIKHSGVRLTQTNEVMGTPSYMAPEQVEFAFGEIDERTDIYALGAILYEMLTGLPPFTAPSIARILWQVVNNPPEKPSKFNPEIPKVLENICLKAMAKQKQERYVSAKEIQEDLQKF